MNFENSMEKNRQIITENIAEFENMKSSGPGGQGADASSSAVRLRVKVEDMPLNNEQKKFVKENVEPHHKTKDGEEILVKNGEERSQEENKEKALQIANEEVERAIRQGYKQRKHEEWKEKQKERKKKSQSGGGPTRNVKDKKKQRNPGAETTDDFIEEAMKHGELDEDEYGSPK